MRHRERLERVEEGHLAVELRTQADRQRALDATLATRAELFDAGAPAAGALDLLALGAASAFAVRLNREEQARLGALAHSQRKVDEQRGVLLERRRDRKAMEALLDHRLDEERQAANREERKLADEMAVVRWKPPAR